MQICMAVQSFALSLLFNAILNCQYNAVINDVNSLATRFPFCLRFLALSIPSLFLSLSIYIQSMQLMTCESLDYFLLVLYKSQNCMQICSSVDAYTVAHISNIKVKCLLLFASFAFGIYC